MASNQRGSGVHGLDHGRFERWRFTEDNSEASICVIPVICTHPGWIEICVCTDSAPLRRLNLMRSYLPQNVEWIRGI